MPRQSVHRPSCILGAPLSGPERHSKPTRTQDRGRDSNRLLGYDGILRKRETTVLLATYLTTTIGTISRSRSFLRETPIKPTKGAMPPKNWPRTSKIQIYANGGLDASLAAEAAARRIMTEELAGCTVLTVAHRGAGLADSDLRVDMACGRIHETTKDRKQGNDENDVDEGMAVGGRRENAMKALAQMAKE